MRIVLLTKISGTRDGEEWPEVGSRLSLPDDEARSLIANGLAAADTAGTVESASMTADAPKARKAR